jgi:DNA helicase-2/ATP-dependent DNA helicase PcrA
MVSTTYSKAKMDDGMSGKRVFHQKFGYGKVTNVDGNKLEIAFEKSGTKTVIKDFVSLA